MNDRAHFNSFAPLSLHWSMPTHTTEMETSDELFLRKVRSCISRRMADSQFGVVDLAACVFLSISQLNRRLNVLVGRPAGQLIRGLRLSNAATWLAYTNMNIGEIAGRTGFSDQAHFCRSFKKCFKSTPSRFRKLHRREKRDDFFRSINARIWQMNAQNVQAWLS